MYFLYSALQMLLLAASFLVGIGWIFLLFFRGKVPRLKGREPMAFLILGAVTLVLGAVSFLLRGGAC